MIKSFHDDIFYVESLARECGSPMQAASSTSIFTKAFLEKSLSAYTEESLEPELSSLALKILQQLCFRNYNAAINLLHQRPNTHSLEEEQCTYSSSLIRIAIRVLLNNGQIIPCLILLKDKIKAFQQQTKAVLIEDINSILSVKKGLNDGYFSHETLKWAININMSYMDYTSKISDFAEKSHEKDPQHQYLSKILEFTIGKQSSYQRLTAQARINKLTTGRESYSIKNNFSENLDPKKIAICTHHKCGTAFLMKTITAISKASNLKVWRKYYEPERYTHDDWDIVFEQHSRIHNIKQTLKGIHCIRRPESLIYSATLYHQKAKEPWLDVPLEKFNHNTYRAFTTGKIYNLINDGRIEGWRKKEITESYECDEPIPYEFDSEYEFNGKSYREMLNSFESLEEKLRFEMQCYSLGVISDMLNFNSKDFYTLKLEDASFNPRMNELYEAFKHIGFEGDKLADCMQVCSDNILALNPDAAGQHGTTKLSDKWKDVFTGKLKTFYHSIYADSSELLGYE